MSDTREMKRHAAHFQQRVKEREIGDSVLVNISHVH